MQLKEIQIRNFRSIQYEDIQFSHNCLVLLGKNEAGKTNILKAIASLFEMYKVSNKDKRKRIENEVISDYCIRAVFSLTKNDFDIVEERFRKRYKGVENIVFTSGITLREFIEKVFYNLNIKIDIGDNSKPNLVYWTYTKKDIELQKQLYFMGNTISKSFLANGIKFDLKTKMFDFVKSLYNESPLKCHYWHYSDSYLLPNTVNINNFIANPSTYKALENLFILCGRDNIKKEFTSALSEDGDYSNLLEQVSKKATSTFQKIWSDFKGTAIQILPNGDEMLIKVAEKAKYNFEDRSDGFKKFISILLMLSTQSRTNKILENDIILIDEPDQSLYPTSAQFLRDELIEISKKSKVIYSTHSQYMIDSECLERHLIVEKKDDVTTIQKENINAPYTKDELLRRAIGSSIFECLKNKNIIFEGYLDRELFKTVCKFNKLEQNFNDYGSVYLSGIHGVDTLVQILILANKKFIIVADSDETSKNKKLEFVKNYPEFKNNWLGYADVCKDISTMEDFMSTKHVETELAKSGYDYIYDDKKNVIINIEKAVNKDKELKQLLKKKLVSTVTKQSILLDYLKYLDELKNKLDSL